MAIGFRVNPVATLCLRLVAAFALVWTGPLFVPAAGGTATVAALMWKAFAASIALMANLIFLRGSGASILGLRPARRIAGLLLLGALLGLLLVGLWLALFRLLVPFRLVSGHMTGPQLLCSACIYLLGALLEELAFRGHALIRLKERYGTVLAVVLVSLAFGLFHLPGMTGANAVKIIALTGLSSVLFCLAYLLSGSLLAAIGLHAGMNFMLHSLVGAGGGRGPSLLTPMYAPPQPVAHDPAFWSLMLAQSAFAAGFLLIWPRLPTFPRQRTQPDGQKTPR